MKSKTIIVGGLVVVFAIIMVVTLRSGQLTGIPKSPEHTKLQIVTTLFPVYDMAQTIGGDYVEVTLLMPPGADVHHFEPSPSDITAITSSDIFVYLGEYMEPWVADVMVSLQKPPESILAAGAHVYLKEETGVHEAEHGEEEHGVDPHTWLDFENAILMAEAVTGRLVSIDPANSAYYTNNMEKFAQELKLLDDTYRQTLATCLKRTIVYGGHYAFGYLTDRYDLVYLAAQGFSSDTEPTASDIAQLIDQVKTNGITHIFYEQMESERIAQTIARETNANMLALQAGHTVSAQDMQSGVSFIDIMRSNLNQLQQGLSCTYDTTNY